MFPKNKYLNVALIHCNENFMFMYYKLFILQMILNILEYSFEIYPQFTFFSYIYSNFDFYENIIIMSTLNIVTFYFLILQFISIKLNKNLDNNTIIDIAEMQA